MIEMIVVAGVGAIFALALTHVLSTGAHASAAATRDADGLRAVTIAIEAIRRDVTRMVVERPGDFSVDRSGSEIGMLVPALSGTDPWEVRCQGVRWRTVGEYGKVRLVRSGPGGERTLRGCEFYMVSFRYVAPGRIAPRRAFLEVYMECPRAWMKGGAYIRNELIPIPTASPGQVQA